MGGLAEMDSKFLGEAEKIRSKWEIYLKWIPNSEEGQG